MNSLEIVSSIKTQSRKKYYDENALKAYKDNLKSYKKKQDNQASPASKATPLDFSVPYDYAVINEFLQINNVNTETWSSVEYSHDLDSVIFNLKMNSNYYKQIKLNRRV